MTSRVIVSVLTPRQGYGPRSHGAIALDIHECHGRSKYGNHWVFGTEPGPWFEPEWFVQIKKRWPWQNHTEGQYAARMIPRLRSINPDLIEVHNSGTVAEFLAEKLDVPVVLFLHNDLAATSGYAHPRDRQRVADKVAGLFFVSDYLRGRFLENGVQARGLVRVVYNGVHWPETVPPEEGRKKQIVYVGRIHEEKGVFNLMDALPDVFARHPDWTATVIGPPSYRNMGRKNKRVRRFQGLLQRMQQRVRHFNFLPQEQVSIILQTSSVAVTPAVWCEPFGRTSVEAMANGVPLVSSRRGGLQEVLSDDCAIIIDPESPDSIRDGIERLIASSSLRREYGDSGRRRARDFSIENSVKSLDAARDDLFASIL
ncbi:glycosyltransferase involved in cell wall biosynthesis [Alkalispirillum mobile]|uniref:Glycosyltransferase involved in cell wall biosynthesis n=1 Tax=Alkalispirillum mobile TaxID=85925 RepID=A0A498C1G9_9GAMM|nr:glycosyltransferase family 4 protein [Alkalispirillum mobile]RLK46990.1 glycosyltransferase involved in cell wall biosynthesis [Alkalispirillum mobile]